MLVLSLALTLAVDYVGKALWSFGVMLQSDYMSTNIKNRIKFRVDCCCYSRFVTRVISKKRRIKDGHCVYPPSPVWKFLKIIN